VALVSGLRGLFRGRPRIRAERRRVTLRDVWLVTAWPAEITDACKVPDPPFADIGGVAAIVERVKERMAHGLSGFYIFTGSHGSGRSTIMKVLNRELRRVGAYSLYIEASGRSLEELVATICSIVGCRGLTLEAMVESIVDKVYSEGAVALFIDNVDDIGQGDVESVSRLLSSLISIYQTVREKIIIAVSLTHEFMAKLTADPVIRSMIRAYIEVVDMDDYKINNVTDLNRLYYAHFSRVRPRELTKKQATLITKYPLHPIQDPDIVALLFELIGPDTPRVYMEKLDELLRIAAQLGSKIVTVTHVNLLARRILEAQRGAVPMARLQLVLLRRYISGLLVGGLVVLGAMAITLALIRLAPPALRLPYMIVGILLIGTGIALHLRSITRPI